MPTAGNHDFLIYPEQPGNAVALVRDFDEANARLIAAAPQLLAACQAALDFLDDGTLWDELSPAERSTQLALRAAIADAIGD